MDPFIVGVTFSLSCLAIAVLFLFKERREDEQKFHKHLNNIRPQSYNPDSAYIYGAPPKWQFDIISDDLGGSTLLGHGWRYEDWLVTCKHVVQAAQEKISSARKVYIRHVSIDRAGTKRTYVKDVASCEWSERAADVAFTVYNQAEFPNMPTATVKSVTQPIIAKISTSFPQDNTSIGTLQNFKFGVLQYDGSTRGGFSGATYVVEGKVVGMHLAGGINNLAYASTYIANLARRQEDSADEVLQRMMSTEDDVEYDEVSPDEVQVHYRGQYFMYDRSDFFRELHSRKNRAYRLAERPVFLPEPESGRERFSREMGTQTEPIPIPKTPKNTRAKARLQLESGPSIPMTRNVSTTIPEEDEFEDAFEAPDWLSIPSRQELPFTAPKNSQSPAKDSLEILAGNMREMAASMQLLVETISLDRSLKDSPPTLKAMPGRQETPKQSSIRSKPIQPSMARKNSSLQQKPSVFNLESSIPSSTQLHFKSLEPQDRFVMKNVGCVSCGHSIHTPAPVSGISDNTRQLETPLDGMDSSSLTQKIARSYAVSSTESLKDFLTPRQKKRMRKRGLRQQMPQTQLTQ